MGAMMGAEEQKLQRYVTQASRHHRYMVSLISCQSETSVWLYVAGRSVSATVKLY